MGIVAAPGAEVITKPLASQGSVFVAFGATRSAIVGFLGLTGWVFDISILKSGWPRLVPIKANSSIWLILLSVSLWLERRENQRTCGRVLAARSLAGLAAAIGLASFLEYLLGWDVGIDQFGRDHQARRRHQPPARGQSGILAEPRR